MFRSVYFINDLFFFSQIIQMAYKMALKYGSSNALDFKQTMKPIIVLKKYDMSLMMSNR